MEETTETEKQIETVQLKIDLGHGELVATFNFDTESLTFEGPGAAPFEEALSADARVVMTIMCGAIARDADLIAKRPKAPDPYDEDDDEDDGGPL